MKRFFLLVLFALAVHSAPRIDTAVKDGVKYILRSDEEVDWWENAVFYQIYPRSFKDSDDDGIGDLKGIIDKLDYLKNTGFTAIWLSPIFKSPQVDQGYDISDYRDIDSDYGTLDDFKNLLKKAHDAGIKVILDFVPNHTSDEHDWFKKSVKKEEGYEDYYVWQDASDTVDSEPQAPNNWISAFGGSAWEWNNDRQQFYLHQFAKQQPDLNYANSKVVDEMKDVLKYWLDLGVDGFRMDAVAHIFEDSNFKDEPLAWGYAKYDVNDYNSLEHVLTKDQEKTFALIYEFREVLDDYTKSTKETKVMMTEAYSPVEKQMLYYGTADGSTLGAHFTFNFNFITVLTSDNFGVEGIIESINKWLAYLPKAYTSNWVLGNHDNHRVATRFGKDNIDALNMLTAFLPGVMVTYNGEEIGMEDGEVKCAEGHDPQATDCDTFDEVSRDFERTPFQWDNTDNAGFTKGDPWLPVSKKAKDVNLKAEDVKGLDSHYNIYKELVTFKKTFDVATSFDDIAFFRLTDNILQVNRRVEPEQEYILLINAGSKEDSADFVKILNQYEVVVSSGGSSYSSGDPVDNVKLKPHESIIIRSAEDTSSSTEDPDASTDSSTSDSTEDGNTSTVETTTAHAEKLLPCLILLLACRIFALF